MVPAPCLGSGTVSGADDLRRRRGGRVLLRLARSGEEGLERATPTGLESPVNRTAGKPGLRASAAGGPGAPLEGGAPPPVFGVRLPKIGARLPIFSTRVLNFNNRVPSVITRVPNFSTRVPKLSNRVMNLGTRVPNLGTRLLKFSTHPLNFRAQPRSPGGRTGGGGRTPRGGGQGGVVTAAPVAGLGKGVDVQPGVVEVGVEGQEGVRHFFVELGNRLGDGDED